VETNSASPSDSESGKSETGEGSEAGADSVSTADTLKSQVAEFEVSAVHSLWMFLCDLYITRRRGYDCVNLRFGHQAGNDSRFVKILLG